MVKKNKNSRRHRQKKGKTRKRKRQEKEITDEAEKGGSGGKAGKTETHEHARISKGNQKFYIKSNHDFHWGISLYAFFYAFCQKNMSWDRFMYKLD